MNAWEPISAENQDQGGPSFQIVRPPPALAKALVFASPHSGRIYPADLMAASRLDAAAIRQSEDAYVDALISAAPAYGAALITARFARAWLDVNRAPWELDPDMFEDELPAYAQPRTARVAAGLGCIARIVSEGEEIYRRKLTFAEARTRVESVHRPYHTALTDLIADTRRRCGAAVLIDWHSMPSAATRQGGAGAGCDVVLGDRFGGACAPAAPRLVEQALQGLGYKVARNSPYAGGYTTEHYGRPFRRIHALQIEINRAIYMDERTFATTSGFAGLKADLETLFAVLGAVDWTAL